MKSESGFISNLPSILEVVPSSPHVILTPSIGV